MNCLINKVFNYKKMKILVTGGCGFIGSNILIFLKKKKFKVFSLDNLYRPGSKLNCKKLALHDIKNYKIDISNEVQINKLPKFDLVIDCCAEASVEKSKTDVMRVFNTNLKGTLNVVQKCIKDRSKIIFLSSSRVYSIEALKNLIKKKTIKKKINIKNQISLNFETKYPKSFYGFTKLSSEELIKEFSYLYSLKYLINRCGVISGPGQFGKQDQGFVSLWVWKHLNKKTLKFIGFGGYGNQIRDVLHINDLCRLIFLQIKNFNKIYNKSFIVGGGLKNSISLLELTKLCEKATKYKCKIKRLRKTSIYDIPYFVSSNRLVKKMYNWQPKHDLKEIVKDIYNWQANSLKKIKKFM